MRLGGIYALERIAQESDDEHGPIVEILCAYVRNHAPRRRERSREATTGLEQHADEQQDADEQEADEQEAAGELRPSMEEPQPVPVDIQAVMTVLARRRVDYDKCITVRLEPTSTRMFGVNADSLLAQDANRNDADLR